MTISSGEDHRQRSTSFIDEEVDLRPEFAPVGGIVAHFLASQRSWGVLGGHRLPRPADPAALAGIVLDHPPPELLEYARPSPPLWKRSWTTLAETPNQSRDGEPSIGIRSTARTYLGVGDRPLGGSGSAAFGPFSLPWLGQLFLQFPPQWPRHPEVLHFRRCGSLSHRAHLLSRMVMVAIPFSERCVFVQGSQGSSRIESKTE